MATLNNMDFIGKWSYGNAGKTMVMACTADKKLVMEPGNYAKPAEAQLFNLYGSMKEAFVIQGPNWLYLSYSDDAYRSDKVRGNENCACFYLSDAGSGQIALVEKTDTKEYYVVQDSAGKINRVEKTPDVPANALLRSNKVTDSLADILSYETTMANPMTGVYLSGKDLTTVNFMGSNVSYADFSQAVLTRTNFNSTVADGTKFDQAQMKEWIANAVNFRNCSFVNIDLTDASLGSVTFEKCTMIKVNFYNATIQSSKFLKCIMIDSSFSETKLNFADFTGSNLTNSDFSAAAGVNTIESFQDAILIGVNLAKTDFTGIKINKNTNFMNAILDDCVFTGMDLRLFIFARASMKRVKLDGTTLDGVQMAFANLTLASVTGSVSMIGANLSNANLSYAKLPGAQLGAKKTLDTLPLSDIPELDNGTIPAALRAKLGLSGAATLKVILPGIAWEVTDGNKLYQVNNTGDKLLVQSVDTVTNAAILSNAYMFMTNLEQANLYAAEMSGVHWYGGSASAKGADLGLANLSNAFLSNMNFKQSQMQGCSLDFAVLAGTVFEGANLNPAANMKPTSFAFSSLQSARFLGTSSLNSANLTNAAFAIAQGVPLFTLKTLFVDTLDNKVITTELRTAFKNAAYVLTSKAAIKVVGQGKKWTIGNIDPDAPGQTGYGNFSLVYEDLPNGIKQIRVYGASPLLVLSANATGGQNQLKLEFGPTGVERNQLSDETTCPSGIKYRFLSDYLAYEELMTAALPPKPPTCLNCWN